MKYNKDLKEWMSDEDYKSAFVWKKKCTHPKIYRTRWSKGYTACGICGKEIK